MADIIISDITSSEGKLSRFSDICLILGEKPKKNLDLFELIKKHTGLTNKNVIERHLAIMDKLGLIQKKQDFGFSRIAIDSYGKALNYFNKNFLRENDRVLHIHEQIIYSYLIMELEQIRSIFDILINDKEKDRDLIIIKYFYRLKNKKIWSNKSINNGIREWENSNKLNRSFQNRFRCMEMWLEDLFLLKKNPYLTYTEKSQLLYRKLINQQNHLSFDHFILAYKEQDNYINLPRDYINLKDMFFFIYNEIKEETNIADLIALFIICSISYNNKYNKFISNTNYNEFMNLLWKEGLISSLSNDKKGHLKYIVLKS